MERVSTLQNGILVKLAIFKMSTESVLGSTGDPSHAGPTMCGKFRKNSQGENTSVQLLMCNQLCDKMLKVRMDLNAD